MKNIIYFLLAIVISSLSACNSNKKQSLYIKRQDIPDSMFRVFLIEKYDISQDGKLSFFECRSIVDLDCNGRNISSVKGIEKFENLKTINCSNNKIKSLDLTNCPKLEEVQCVNNKIEEILIPKTNKISKLYCAMNELTKLNTPRLTNLTTLDCASNKLTELNTDNNKKLVVLKCNDNLINQLDLYKNDSIREVLCFRNPKLKKMIINKMSIYTHFSLDSICETVYK
jgi:hypothetical protein